MLPKGAPAVAIKAHRSRAGPPQKYASRCPPPHLPNGLGQLGNMLAFMVHTDTLPCCFLDRVCDLTPSLTGTRITALSTALASGTAWVAPAAHPCITENWTQLSTAGAARADVNHASRAGPHVQDCAGPTPKGGLDRVLNTAGSSP
jgi:hypothetical protein